MGALTRTLAAVAVALCLACAGPVRVESFPEAQGRALAKLALLPLEDSASNASAGALVTGRVLEALTQVGQFEVIPPSEAVLALRAAGDPKDSKAMGRVLAAAFGCDGIASGSVARFVERVGGTRGVTHPASVAFELEVRAPDGSVLWHGRYDETQEDVAGNALSLGRAWRRGFKWVTADALAADGARQLAEELRRSASSWR